MSPSLGILGKSESGTGSSIISISTGVPGPGKLESGTGSSGISIGVPLSPGPGPSVSTGR